MIYHNYSHLKFFWLNVFGLIFSTENIFAAYMLGSLINMATKKEFSALPSLLVQIVVVLTIILVSGLLFNYLKTDAVKQVNTKLRTKVLKGMLLNKEEDSNDLGFLTNDFKLLETNRYEAEIEILIYTYTVILALGYALYLNWFVTLIYFVGSAIPTIVSNFFQKPIQKASGDWTEANDKYVSQTKNILAGTSTFNLYGKQDNAVKQNKRVVERLEEKLAKMNLLNNNTNTYLDIIAVSSAFLLPLGFGLVFVVNGQITLGALFAITQLSNSFVNPILQILNERNNLSTTKGIVNKIKQFIAKGEQKPKNDVATGDFKQLEVKNLTLKRQGKELASQINFAVAKGQKVAVIGPSGSGKSTMLQYLMYGDYGQAQEELLNQKAVKPGTFTNLFAYSSQSAVIFADSLWFNLTLGADIPREKVTDVCEHLELGQLVKEKGFDYQLGDNADQLSGGQLARIELARAILAKRPILLLDEVNASLDKATSQAIHDYLFDSDFTFIEVIHHYEPAELKRYDTVIDFNDYI
ncbi:ATP-binding cassette domain-containing protein [Lactobacillus helsingborgensis]|uniref:ATP-binding cassette domain-containing protein n=1 Tax=Lactobacillus helsingborgensis TaxID=1218494 RepID=UPI002264803B|nr:ABC transporter ATP-binding protein [Lactobacillus helsingborgensis]UZX31543.1 ABC transporter ATP-binding protein/permease [Lactobacillus helsingborgensis]